MTGGLAPSSHLLGCPLSRAKRFAQSAPCARTQSHRLLRSSRSWDPHQPPHNPSPFPLDPHSPFLLAPCHCLHSRSLSMACYSPSTTIGAHKRQIRAGEEQLQSRWGAAARKMKEVRRPSLPPRCCSSSLPPCLAAQQPGTRGRSSPTLLHLSFLHPRGLEEQVREAAMASGVLHRDACLQGSDLVREVWYNP